VPKPDVSPCPLERPLKDTGASLPHYREPFFLFSAHRLLADPALCKRGSVQLLDRPAVETEDLLAQIPPKVDEYRKRDLDARAAAAMTDRRVEYDSNDARKCAITALRDLDARADAATKKGIE
jgi:hypothetical protein